jgi:glycosyltransferase involved in cell wall biosynthesis
MMSVVGELGYTCRFVGASRETDLPRTDRWDGYPILRVGRSFPLVNGRRPLTYLGGVLSFWRGVMGVLRRERPRLVHASDFETGVPAIVAGRLLGIPVVYNIHDNLAMRYALPRWAVSALNVVEGLLVRAADVTLVPEPFRRDLLPAWARDRVHVVRNAPGDPGFSPPAPDHSRPPRVLFAGWLDAGRGLRQMMALARAGHIRLIVAGEGDAAIRAELATNPNVEYLGFCTHGQIMARTAECDYVAAFYDPVRAINRYAASNKIAEALAVGRPVLTNRELLVAASLERAAVAISVPYSDAERLGPILADHFADREGYLTACRRARALYEAEYHADRVRGATINALTHVGLGPWPSTTAN